MEKSTTSHTSSSHTSSSDCRREPVQVSQDQPPEKASRRLDLKEFRLPQKDHANPCHAFRSFCSPGKQFKVEEYYKQQERFLEGFSEMETMTEQGCLPGGLTEKDNGEGSSQIDKTAYPTRLNKDLSGQMRISVYSIIKSSAGLEQTVNRLLKKEDKLASAEDQMRFCYGILSCCAGEKLYYTFYGSLLRRLCEMKIGLKKSFTKILSLLLQNYLPFSLNKEKEEHAKEVLAWLFSDCIISGALPLDAILQTQNIHKSSYSFFKLILQNMTTTVGKDIIVKRFVGEVSKMPSGDAASLKSLLYNLELYALALSLSKTRLENK